VVTALGSGRRPAVKVTLAGHTYRSSVASMGGRFMLGISAEIRQITGVTAGDHVELDLELDTEPREVAVPPDLAAALAGDPEAGRFFAGLSYSNQRRHVMAIDQAKTDQTRQRRIEKAVELFHQGKS
jgi:uncharacterized protein YdeI (YjbR/CyaY-like superfamily)